MDEEEEDYHDEVEAIASLYIMQSNCPEFMPQISESIKENTAQTVQYFRNKLEDVRQEENKIRNKLKSLRHFNHQLSLYLNKTMELKYGTIPTETFIKQIIPPLPQFDESLRSDLLRILHSSTPSFIEQYLKKEGVMQKLIFGDYSVFDEQVLNSLMRTPPDIQIAFFTTIIDMIITCRNFYNKLLPLMSQLSMDSALRSQLLNPNSTEQDFFRFYNTMLRKITNLLEASHSTILYSMNEGRELYHPTEKYAQIIDVNDSLIGVLYKNIAASRVDEPRFHPNFVSSDENILFEKNIPICTATFKSGPSNVEGIIIVYKKTSFTATEQVLVNTVAEYLTPIFRLLKSVFLQATPAHFSILGKAVASVRQGNDLFEEIHKQIHILTSASFSKLYINGPNTDFPNIPMLPKEPSLAKKSFDMKTSFSYKNPRNRSDFSKEVDEEPTLSKISSYMVVPITNSPIVILCYNSTASSEFTPIQKSMVNLFTVSLPPLLHQHSMRHQMERLKDMQKDKIDALTTTLDSLRPLSVSVQQNHFLKVFKKFLPPNVGCLLFFFLNEGTVLRIPQCQLWETTELLSDIQEASTFTEFDVEVEAGGDEEVKKLFVIPSFGEYKTICCFTSHDPDAFEDDNYYLTRIARNLLLFLPSFVIRYQMQEVTKRHKQIQNILDLNLKELSSALETEIECHYFDPPLKEDPHIEEATLTISIETPRGIEAALTSKHSIKDKLLKDAIISYAEWFTAVLTAKKPLEEAPSIVLSFLIDCGVLDVFACTIFDLTEWVSRVVSIFESNGISTKYRSDECKFVYKLLECKRWGSWYGKEEKVVIMLLTLLQGLERVWRCKPDDELIKLAQDCDPSACVFIACIFGNGIALSPNLNKQTRDLLVDCINAYAFHNDVKMESMLMSHIRLISLQNYKATIENKILVAKALILLSCIQGLAETPEKTAQNLIIENDEQKAKILMFKTERVYMSLLTFLAQRTESILQNLSNVRSALKILHSHYK